MMLVPLARMRLDPHGPLGVTMVMVAGVLGDWVLFAVVETPFMTLRERLFPGGKIKPAVPGVYKSDAI